MKGAKMIYFKLFIKYKLNFAGNETLRTNPSLGLIALNCQSPLNWALTDLLFRSN